VQLPVDVFLLLREVHRNEMVCLESTKCRLQLFFMSFYVKWVPCHHGTARPHVANEEKAFRYGG
jgi:hypothetical protein